MIITGTPAADASPVRVRAATFNIGASNSKVPGMAANWRDRLAATVHTIREETPDVVALQEVMSDQWLELRDRLVADGSYETWPTTWGSANKYAGINPVLYRRATTDFEWGEVIYPPALQNISHRSKGLAVVGVRKAGRLVIVASVHDPAQPDQAQVRLDNARWYRAQVKRYARAFPAAVIVWAGDYNHGWRVGSPSATVVDGDPLLLSPRVIERGGIVADAARVSMGWSAVSLANYIDHLLVSRNASVAGYWSRPGLESGSDLAAHPFHVADYTAGAS